jgi:hypothetical protein
MGALMETATSRCFVMTKQPFEISVHPLILPPHYSYGDGLTPNHRGKYMSHHFVSPQPSSQPSPQPSLADSRNSSLQHSATQLQSLRLWLTIRFAKLIERLTRSPEPQVKFRRDRHGYHHWEVFDPATGQTALLDSAQAVRMWLEQRYHR